MFVMDMLEKIELMIMNKNNECIKTDLIKLKLMISKYIPMLPENKKGFLKLECPNCLGKVNSKWMYCPFCGQRIKKYHEEFLNIDISCELEQEA